MTHTYSGGEVLFIATQIEHNGSMAYRQLAKRNPTLSELFARLAADEDEHHKVFARLREEAGDTAVLHDDEETRTYLSRLAGDYVFPADADPMAPFAAAQTRREVLDVAISLEQRSISLYEAMLKAVSRPGEQQLIGRIIAEEQRHIADLSKARDGV